MNLIDQIALAAVEAGKEILQVYEKEFTVEYKADESPLTLADSRAHDIITRYLEQTPYPILSEEGRDIPFEERARWDNYWLVDPLDGTKEFVNRSGEFTVNIALIRDGKPVMGVVYTPVKKWLYIGSEEEGAWKLELENHQLPGSWRTVAEHLPVKNATKRNFTVVGSRSHRSKETDDFIAKLEEEHGELNFVSMGSSLKICLVVEGTADVYPRLAPTMEWDTAAGDAIARSAGCEVVQFENGEPLRYNKENLLNPWFIVQR